MWTDMTFSPFVEKIAKQIKVSKAFDLLLQPACRYIWLLMWLWTINALAYNKQRQRARKNKWNKILHLEKCFFCQLPALMINNRIWIVCDHSTLRYLMQNHKHIIRHRSWKNIMMIWMQKHWKNCTFLSFWSILYPCVLEEFILPPVQNVEHLVNFKSDL